MNIQAKDVLIRALKTFWQAALASLMANFSILADALVSEGAWKRIAVSIAVGAIAAGLSAVYNGIIKPLLGPPA